MRVTREEADALYAERKAHAPRRAEPQLAPEFLEQAKVATQQLTGDPAWDVFLQRVQALIDRERELLTAMAESMSPSMTNEQVLQAHRHMVAARAKVEAWEQVLRLPNAILSGTEEADIKTAA